jgi:hypothetical protein
MTCAWAPCRLNTSLLAVAQFGSGLWQTDRIVVWRDDSDYPALLLCYHLTVLHCSLHYHHDGLLGRTLHLQLHQALSTYGKVEETSPPSRRRGTRVTVQHLCTTADVDAFCRWIERVCGGRGCTEFEGLRHQKSLLLRAHKRCCVTVIFSH